MNKIKRIRISALVIAAMLVVPITITSCVTPDGSSQSVAFHTLKSIQIAVDGAMRVYGTAVVTGKVSAGQQQAIETTHENYRQAFQAAVSLARSDLSSIAPTEVVRLANELQVLISRL